MPDPLLVVLTVAGGLIGAGLAGPIGAGTGVLVGAAICALIPE